MATAILYKDKLIRLMYCLTRSCTKVTKALVLHYLALAKPSDIEEQEWNIDEFLNIHREGIILKNFNKDINRRKVLFPTPIKPTNIDHWDLAALFTVLRLFKNIDRSIIADMNQMRMVRNKLFHRGLEEMTDSYFNKNKRKIEIFVDNCCKVINNESIAVEVEVILEDIKDYESIEKDIQKELENWKKDDILDILDNHEQAIIDQTEVIYTHVSDMIEMKEQHMPEINLTLEIKNCNKETSSRATDMICHDIRCPPPECEPERRQLWYAIDEALQNILCKNRSLVKTCKACVILTVQCPNFNSLKSLLEECLTGKLTAAWTNVETILRHLVKNDELTLEFTITKSDFWCCIEKLIETLTTAVHEHVGVDVSPHQSPEIIVHPPTAHMDGEGTDTVTAVPITIKPKSYRHALEVSDVLQSGSLNEDFRKISTLLANLYGMNDVTITANLEASEPGDKEVLTENEPKANDILINTDVQKWERNVNQPELESYPEVKPFPSWHLDPRQRLSINRTPEPELGPVTVDVESVDYHPRVCQLPNRNDDHQGFDLVGQKVVPVQNIGSVTNSYSAKIAGVQPGDKVVDVKVENNESYCHQQVVHKFRSELYKTLSVVEMNSEEYYKNGGNQITANLTGVFSKSTKGTKTSDKDAKMQYKIEKLKHEREKLKYKKEKLEFNKAEKKDNEAEKKNNEEILKYVRDNLLEKSGKGGWTLYCLKVLFWICLTLALVIPAFTALDAPSFDSTSLQAGRSVIAGVIVLAIGVVLGAFFSLKRRLTGANTRQ